MVQELKVSVFEKERGREREIEREGGESDDLLSSECPSIVQYCKQASASAAASASSAPQDENFKN